jgi:phosphatidylglycerol:prolipoprotein diacylglycerol transferase
MIGGRLGYVFFYNFSYYLSNPLKALAVWEGGMSFHGGIIGVTIAILLYGRFMPKNIWSVADEVAVTVPF